MLYYVTLYFLLYHILCLLCIYIYYDKHNHVQSILMRTACSLPLGLLAVVLSHPDPSKVIPAHVHTRLGRSHPHL